MRKSLLLFVSTLLFLSFSKSDVCETMYNNATFGVMHSKKALNARNFDDQRYFAKKALAAYERVLENLENCGCNNLTEKVEVAIEHLEIAIDPYDWDKGRYYSKRVYLNSLDLVSEMDELTAQDEEKAE